MDRGTPDLELKTTFGRLVDTDVSTADSDAVARVAADAARVRAFVDHVTMRARRRTTELAAAAATGSAKDRLACTHDETAAEAVAAADLLCGAGGLSGRDARDVRARDHVCSDFPVFDDALAAGSITAGHVDLLARAVRGLSDVERSDVTARIDEILEHATGEPVGVFERSLRHIIDAIRASHRDGSDADELDRQRQASTVKRWTDRDTGMKNTLISLDPLRDAQLWTAINAELGRLRYSSQSGESFMALQVQAVLNTITNNNGGSGAGGQRVADIIVHVDAASLCHGRHADTLCETIDGEPLPVSTVQRLCCEAVLSAVIMKPDGTVEQLCAELRTANRSQRRRLAAMYATCAHPSCEVGFDHCRIHHVVWFSKGGKTVIDNLVPLCERHHHLVHEGGWNLTLTPDRQLDWHRPDGTIWTTNGPNRRTPTRSNAESEQGRSGPGRSCDRPERSPTSSGPAPPPAARGPAPPKTAGATQPRTGQQQPLFDPVG